MITLMLLVWAGCEEPAPLPEGPKVETLLGPSLGIHFVGNWTSPACGARTYPRNIHFDASNQYAAIDMVAPCPVGASCVWSGLVGYAGTWVIKDDALILKEMHAPGAPGAPHPEKFLASMEGKLMEGDCAYTEGLNIPEGYTESQVTPRAPGSPEPTPKPETGPTGGASGATAEGPPSGPVTPLPATEGATEAPNPAPK